MPGTSARTASPEDATTGTFGNARPSSSAVRSAPTVTRRIRGDPQAAQDQACAERPHQPHRGTPRRDTTPRGPSQAVQRAGSRQRSHARCGA